MKHDSRKSKKLLDTTLDNRTYNINHRVPVPYTYECCLCPRRKRCKKSSKCNSTRFIRRNWKQFRNTRWK